MSDPDDLDRLAERGRAIAEATAQRARAREAGASTNESVEGRLRMRRTLSAYARYLWWMLGGAAWVATALLVIEALPLSWREEPDPALLTGIAVGSLALAATFALRPFFGERAIAAEQAWLSTAPFPLTGYVELLCSSTTEGELTVDVRFAPDSPKSTGDMQSFRAPAATSPEFDPAAKTELLKNVIGTVGGRVEERADLGVQQIHIKFDFGDSSVSHNARAHAWLRQVVGLLIAVHGRHPIEAVHVRGFS